MDTSIHKSLQTMCLDFKVKKINLASPQALKNVSLAWNPPQSCLMLSLTLYASLNIASAAIVVISVRRSVHVIAAEGTEGDEKREKMILYIGMYRCLWRRSRSFYPRRKIRINKERDFSGGTVAFCPLIQSVYSDLKKKPHPQSWNTL